MSIGTTEGRGSRLSIICDMVGQGDENGYSASITTANAELIVRAVNSQAALIAACEAALAELPYWSGPVELQLKAALALAKELNSERKKEF